MKIRLILVSAFLCGIISGCTNKSKSSDEAAPQGPVYEYDVDEVDSTDLASANETDSIYSEPSSEESEETYMKRQRDIGGVESSLKDYSDQPDVKKKILSEIEELQNNLQKISFHNGNDFRQAEILATQLASLFKQLGSEDEYKNWTRVAESYKKQSKSFRNHR